IRDFHVTGVQTCALPIYYDHIGIAEKGFEGDFINNGANDNASGTTILSEVAKYLGASKNNKRSVMFVFFSAEEKGLLGAKHLAKIGRAHVGKECRSMWSR